MKKTNPTRRILVLAALFGVLFSTGCDAGEPEAAAGKQAAPAATAVQADASLKAAIKARLEGAFRGIQITEIGESPVPGLMQVRVNGSDLAFVTPDGEYVIVGDILQLREGGAVNLEDERLSVERKAAFVAIDPKDMITFAASEPKEELYVFTDISCGYCRHMHQQIQQYNDLGMTVHYLAFPREGSSGKIAQTMENVWCAEDRKAAITEAKATGGLKNAPVRCDAPIKAQYDLGQRLGVDGTPAVFTAEGKQVGGYVAPEELAGRLGLNKK